MSEEPGLIPRKGYVVIGKSDELGRRAFYIDKDSKVRIDWPLVEQMAASDAHDAAWFKILIAVRDHDYERM
jgi:hypothetical protein